MSRFAVVLVLLLSACASSDLQRQSRPPLTVNTYAVPDSTPAQQGQSYNRHDIGVMTMIDYGVIVDKAIVNIDGTTESGARVGSTLGALNSINRASSSTESWVARMVVGAVVGAAIESSLTKGQAVEYFIKKTSGQLFSVLSVSVLNVGSCVLIRSGVDGSGTTLELKGQQICRNM